MEKIKAAQIGCGGRNGAHFQKLSSFADVDIVGFDNISISRMTFPQITTVAQPCFEIGDEAASLLTRLITDRTQASRGIVLRHSLVIRDTTRTPPLA